MIKQFYFKQLNLACNFHIVFKCQIILFDLLIGYLLVLPHWVRVDLGAMALKGTLHFSISGASQSDSLVSYIGHSMERMSYSFREMLSGYSTAPAYWAVGSFCDR